MTQKEILQKRNTKFDDLGSGQHYRELMKLFTSDEPRLQQHQMNQMVDTILRRKRFTYSYFEAFTKGFVLKCCKYRYNCIKDSTMKRYLHLDKATKMLKRKLDISELLKTVQRNQTL